MAIEQTPQQFRQPPSPKESYEMAKMATRKMNRANDLKLAAGLAASGAGFLPGMALHNNWLGAQEAVQPFTESIANSQLPEFLKNLASSPEALGGTLQTAGLVGVIGMLGASIWQGKKRKEQVENMARLNAEVRAKELAIQHPEAPPQMIQTQAQQTALRETKEFMQKINPKEEKGFVDKAMEGTGKFSLGLFAGGLALENIHKVPALASIVEGMGVSNAAVLGAGMGELSLALLAPVMIHSTFKHVKDFFKDRDRRKMEEKRIQGFYDELNAVNAQQNYQVVPQPQARPQPAIYQVPRMATPAYNMMPA